MERFAFQTLFLLVMILFNQSSHAQRIINYVNDISYILENDTNKYRKEKCKINIKYTSGTRDRPVVIYLHGGGLTSGDRQYLGMYLDEDIVNVAVGYRLSPIVKNPTYIEDVAEAVSWVWKNIERYGGDKRKIYLIGHSSGAYLTAMIALDKSYLNKFDVDADSLGGFLCFSGQMTTHFAILNERGIAASFDSKFVDEFAPLSHIRKIKPFIIFAIADRNNDLLGRFDQNSEIVNKLKDVGNKTCLWEFLGTDHYLSMIEAAGNKFLPMLLSSNFDISDFSGNPFNSLPEVVNFTEIKSIISIDGKYVGNDLKKIKKDGIYIVTDGVNYRKTKLKVGI